MTISSMHWTILLNWCWGTLRGCWSSPVIVKLTNCPCLRPTETALHWTHSLSFEPHELINYIVQHVQGRAIGKTIPFSSKCTPCFLGTCYTFIKSRLTMRTSLHKCIAIVAACTHTWAHAPRNHPLTPAHMITWLLLSSPIGDSLLSPDVPTTGGWLRRTPASTALPFSVLLPEAVLLVRSIRVLLKPSPRRQRSPPTALGRNLRLHWKQRNFFGLPTFPGRKETYWVTPPGADPEKCNGGC